ncbi:MAG TPA: hypothetical protein VIZ87_02055, partial [Terrimicrobium sp.]
IGPFYNAFLSQYTSEAFGKGDASNNENPFPIRRLGQAGSGGVPPPRKPTTVGTPSLQKGSARNVGA